MNQCFNPVILSFMSIFIQFCLNNLGMFISSFDYAQKTMSEKKIYLKKAFDHASMTLYGVLKNEMLPYFKKLSDEGSITEQQKATYKKAQEAFEVVEVIKSGVDRFAYSQNQTGIPPSKKMMNCFLHNDKNPSMNYVTSDTQQGFHCFSCGLPNEVIDVFGLIKLYGEWQGEGSLTFKEQMAKAEKLFVNGDIATTKVATPVFSVASPTDSTKDFIPYTGQMKRAMHNPYMFFVKLKDDEFATQYLKGREISLRTATRLGVMSLYPQSNQGGGPAGRAFLVFFCADGTFTKRVIAENEALLNRSISGSCAKWTNKKNCEIGVFNGQVIEHCIDTNEPVFVCEGPFDALSCEELGFHAVAINGVCNINRFLTANKDNTTLKLICLADTDGAGRAMAKFMGEYAERKLYVPEIYLNKPDDSFFCANKDINECLKADRQATYKMLYDFRQKATEFYGY